MKRESGYYWVKVKELIKELAKLQIDIERLKTSAPSTSQYH